MRLPTIEQSLDWAREEAFLLPEKPTQQRKHLLILLHHIKKLEDKVARYESDNQSPHGETYDQPS